MKFECDFKDADEVAEPPWTEMAGIVFAPSEPFAVANGVDDGDEDEEESYLAVDSADWGVTVNQPLRNGEKSCQDGECNQDCEGFGGSGGFARDFLCPSGYFSPVHPQVPAYESCHYQYSNEVDDYPEIEFQAKDGFSV